MLSGTIRIYALKHNKDYYTVLLLLEREIMSRRRKIDSEDVGERVSTSLRLPIDLLNQIDQAWKSSDEFTGRTHYIEKACEYYLDSYKCPNCGNINSKYSVVCSRCETRLKGFSEKIDEVSAYLIRVYDPCIKSIYDNISAYEDLNGKINWLLEKLSPTRRVAVDSVISPIYTTILNGINKGYYFIETDKKYSQYNKLPLPSPIDLLCDRESLEKFVLEHGFSSTSGLGASINAVYYYHYCKLLLENTKYLTMPELSSVYDELIHKGPHIISLSNDVGMALETLKGVEKMITILMQNQNP